MLDRRNTPDAVADSFATVNPYLIPAMIWSMIEDYFKNKYQVQIVENFPEDDVTRPAIVWYVHRRIPGGSKSGKFQVRGPGFSHYLGITPDGMVQEVEKQEQRAIIHFQVYAATNALADAIAWDLEQAILMSVGPLQEKIPGFTLTFIEQLVDSSLRFRNQTALVLRTLAFEASFYVQYLRLSKALTSIEVHPKFGPIVKQLSLVRESDSREFRLPLFDVRAKISDVTEVTLERNGRLVTLERDVDYYVRTDENGILYIEWEDDHGITPAVGEGFKVVCFYLITRPPVKVTN